MGRSALLALGTICGVVAADVVRGQVADANPDELQKIGVDEKLGERLRFDLRFRADSGDSATLGDYFKSGKPVILILYYSDCPMLCSLVLTALQKGIAGVDFKPGVDYRLLTVSIDPNEPLADIQGGHSRFTNGFPEGNPPLVPPYFVEGGKGPPNDAWTFLIGGDSAIAKLAAAVGFRYFYDARQQQFAHPAVVMVLTPDGRVSRYLYGIDYKPNDIRMALLEASAGRIGNTVDRILLYCYHYDPQAGGYVVMAGRIMKLGGAATLGIFGLLLAGLWTRERKKQGERRQLTTDH